MGLHRTHHAGPSAFASRETMAASMVRPEPCQQLRLSILLIEPHQIDVGDLAENSLHITCGNSNWYPPPVRSGGSCANAAAHSGCVKRLLEVVGRQDRDSPVRNGCSDFRYEVATRIEIPCLDNRRVARLLQLPGHPSGPFLIDMVGSGHAPITEHQADTV